MTQHEFISSLRTLCRTHVKREQGDLSLVYDDLLNSLSTIIAPFRDTGDEFYIGIRPFGFECCTTRSSFDEKLSLFKNQTILVYAVAITRYESDRISYRINYISTRTNR